FLIWVFCYGVSPPTCMKISAIADWAKPSAVFTEFGGDKEPLVDCIPKTNVAESAEVMKKIIRSKSAIMDKGIDKGRSEEHTSELQSRFDLVCRLLLEKKKK